MRSYHAIGKISRREAARDAMAAQAVFGVLPKRIAAAVSAEFDRLTDRGELVAANIALTQAGQQWKRQTDERRVLDFVDDAGEICGKQGIKHADLVALAQAGAGAVSGVAVGLAEDQAAEVADMIAAEVGAGFPADCQDAGKIARGKCSVYWRRQLSGVHGRKLEQNYRLAGQVSRKAGLYCSDETIELRRAQTKRNSTLLKTLKAINEAGQEYTLAELAALGMANPKNRKGELMVRIRGFEEIARGCGHAGEFYTLTAPSRFHPVRHDGKPNQKYDGSTPRQAQAYLCRVWAKIRSALHRRGIAIYGFRVAEPHHDGTPHWHMLLFVEQQHVETVRALMARYAFEDSPEELKSDKAKKARFCAVAIDWSRGSAAGYIAKYICKNVDGRTAGDEQAALVDADHEAGEGAQLAETAERVDAWAACWGIRQFQQIGGAPVSVWRELRRLDLETVGGDVAALVAAADSGNWSEFCGLMAKCEAGIIRREVGPGRYGETVFQPVGVSINGAEVVTRFHEWFIGRDREVKEELERRGYEAALEVVRRGGVSVCGGDGSWSDDSRVSCDYRGGNGEGFAVDVLGFGVRQAEGAAAWTGVNNCTVPAAPGDWSTIFDAVDDFLRGAGHGQDGKIGGSGGAGERQKSASGGWPNKTGGEPVG